MRPPFQLLPGKRIIPAALIFLTLNLFADEAAEPTPVHRDSLQPFLEKYCIKCHGPKKDKGDVRFDTVHWQIANNADAQDWQDVLDVLNSGDMPPEDERQPSEVEFSQVVGILTENLSEARDRLSATGGANPIRRLNKREYINTIKELFGFNIAPSLLPDDIRGEHFDTAGGEQYFDGPLLEQYMQIGTAIAQEGFRWSGLPYTDVTTKRFETEDLTRNRKPHDASLPKLDSGIYLFRGSRTWRTIAIPHGEDPRASYRVRLQAGALQPEWPLRHYIKLTGNSPVRGHAPETIGLMKVKGTVTKPASSELLVPRTTLGLTHKQSIVLSEIVPRGMTNIIRWFPIYLNRMGVADKHEPNAWLDWIELEGPFYESKENDFGTLISKEGENLASKGKARELLKKFAYEAFRHVPPSSQYLDKLEAYFQSRMNAGQNYTEAMAGTIGIVLASPNFLYLEENQFKRSKHLSERAFATRLAYFLWSAPPDAELYQAAQKGELFKPGYLRQQVLRMLADPKADHFYHGFMSQWAELDRFEDISVAWKSFMTFNEGVFYSAYQEPIEFFKVLVRENLPVSNLVDSDFVVVNSALAQFYGFPVEGLGNEFKKIPTPAGSHRGGFITQTAFLTTGSNGTRTSPVIRGTLILEKLLNNPPPQPPPNVPEIESASSKPLTTRELTELHREQKVCASCHDKIDPIGFGLEHFDTVGLWRDTETIGKKEEPIKSGGTLVSGKKFDDLEDLKRLLKSQEHHLAENLAESLFGYGIGRPAEFSDAPAIGKILELAQESNYSMQDLILLIVDSKAFRSK